MKLSGRDDKLSGLGLVGPADIHASMVAPCVPNHQVRCEDNDISGNWLSICTKDRTKSLARVASNQTDGNGTGGEEGKFKSLRRVSVARETAEDVKEATQT